MCEIVITSEERTRLGMTADATPTERAPQLEKPTLNPLQKLLAQLNPICFIFGIVRKDEWKPDGRNLI
ncbi:hypothetical protein A2634_04390 [Candidatus Amesbacteria bacterium RIFCSPHIGHO2_01_FULL_48_32]|uniref:Uncharacterized protein n=1 Tax=Candidatus Amesbacteria bacterium RIFCSPLOWO2_01_FULL_48_25 TaxID=1797259 RepID=A0A1F4ZC65_9BACT|nr:MAG: hypothetical protein A2634_04390 [Candidatus Amesbacteria bacterium RIFCSPHIGHO2_01_FULL_48_32]OGD03788.1 MAG: hypothetical protein A2989_03855 [Candidatus Amesbacteria bacterium RIFCSPLOWO2_01_FULL_48_25]HJZ05105.1 hypothetical protein [Patescibacteria group bacterium]